MVTVVVTLVQHSGGEEMPVSAATPPPLLLPAFTPTPADGRLPGKCSGVSRNQLFQAPLTIKFQLHEHI